VYVIYNIFVKRTHITKHKGYLIMSRVTTHDYTYTNTEQFRILSTIYIAATLQYSLLTLCNHKSCCLSDWSCIAFSV